MASTFKRNIIIGFGISLLLLILSSVASFISITNLLSSAGWVDHTHKVITALEGANSLLLKAEASQRGYLLTADRIFLENVDSSTAQAQQRIGEIMTLTADNPGQQQRARELRTLAGQRIELLRTGIRLREGETRVTPEFLRRGRVSMENAQALIARMTATELELLQRRTQRLETFSGYTPILIIVAALISLVITIIFYRRVSSDYRKRSQLQEELVRKDEDLGKRIAIIQDIAEKISSGNYKIRVDDEGNDLLGNVAGSLNRMGESLEYSFGLLSDKEWLQAGVAGLNQTMLGEKDMDDLARDILQFVAEWTGSRVGAFYLTGASGELRLTGGYALSQNISRRVQPGEGLAGQVALAGRRMVLDDVPPGQFTISFAAGQLRPATVTAFPILHEHRVSGVIELGSLRPYTAREYNFLEAVSQSTGVAIHMAQNRRRLQELLEETQSQTEELHAQHSELENINEELKSQTQKLQMSEEELRVQQEELMQTNSELEERTRLLMERNDRIEQQNKEIQHKAAELEQSTRYKSEFLANMSHELRTPLNSILLLSRLMAENTQVTADPVYVEYAQVIQSSGQALLSLIDEILDLSRIEAGKMDIEFREVSLREITNDLQALFAPLAAEKKLTFSIDIAPGVPGVLETDRMRLDQVLKNLVSNAIKFTAGGSVTVSIAADPSDAGTLLFSVRDTGIGIPSDKQQVIFEAFRQADGSTKRQYGGTGLGLSISRELAGLLGGRLELGSEPGKGSEFRLYIPVRRPVVAVKGEEPAGAAQVPERPASPPLAGEAARPVLVTENDTSDKMSQVFRRIEDVLRMQPGKVLIVEEDPRHARALSYFLEGFQIHSGVRSTVAQCIEALTRNDVHCVILDAGAGESFEALEQVRSAPGLQDLPIIVFTGRSLSGPEEARIRKSADSIVIKTAHSYQRILDEVSLFLHPLKEARNHHAGNGQPRLGRLTEVLSGKTVLIADDDVRNIFSLSKALEGAGMNIISATDGKEAIEQLEHGGATDIILMDMMMPEMDGYETMRRIRLMPRYGKLPIIAVTAKAMAGDREKCISSGASDYITKPVDKDQLMSLLRVWLYDRN